jgi:hypothetical protein
MMVWHVRGRLRQAERHRFEMRAEQPDYRRASMSACMRFLYSSDQWAPGFSLVFLSGCEMGGVLFAATGLRAPALSLSVGRDGEFGLFIQLWAPI